MISFGVDNVPAERVAAFLKQFPDGSFIRKSEWSIPVGECLIEIKITGITDKSDQDAIQCAIDVLEVVKKHSSALPVVLPSRLTPDELTTPGMLPLSRFMIPRPSNG